MFLGKTLNPLFSTSFNPGNVQTCLKNVAWELKQITLPASDIFCRLLLSLANGLCQDQVQYNVRPDMDVNCLTL